MSLPQLSVASIVLLLSPIFRQLPFYLQVLVTLTTLSLILKKRYSVLLIALLIIFQATSTRLQTNFEFSSYQLWYHQQLLNSYPPPLWPLANIIENKIQSPLFYRFQENLFSTLDFTNHFRHHFPSFIFPFFLIGLIKCFYKKQLPSVVFIIFIVASFIFGAKGDYGPLSVLPLMAFLTSYVLK